MPFQPAVVGRRRIRIRARPPTHRRRPPPLSAPTASQTAWGSTLGLSILETAYSPPHSHPPLSQQISTAAARTAAAVSGRRCRRQPGCCVCRSGSAPAHQFSRACVSPSTPSRASRSPPPRQQKLPQCQSLRERERPACRLLCNAAAESTSAIRSRTHGAVAYPPCLAQLACVVGQRQGVHDPLPSLPRCLLALCRHLLPKPA